MLNFGWLRDTEKLKAEGLTDEQIADAKAYGFSSKKVLSTWREMKEQGIGSPEIKKMEAFGYSFARTVEVWKSSDENEDKHFFACFILAGLICMYDHENYLYLHVTYDEDVGRCIAVLKAENKKYSYPFGFIPVEDGEMELEVAVCEDKLKFFYKTGYREKQEMGSWMDCSFLSDEACNQGWFTGTMVGLCCQDLTGGMLYADFDWFEYEERAAVIES